MTLDTRVISEVSVLYVYRCLASLKGQIREKLVLITFQIVNQLRGDAKSRGDAGGLKPLGSSVLSGLLEVYGLPRQSGSG